MGPAPAAVNPLDRERNQLIRRSSPDHSQQIRHTAQGLFVALNLWLGIQFFLWVRYFEQGGAGLFVPRPAGAEGWLPIAGLMNFKLLLLTGKVPSVHPAAMFLFIAFVLMSLLLKKSFCSWLCPVGTLSEILWKLGRRVFKRNLRLPRWADLPLRGLKYLLLAFFVFIIGSMSAAALQGFMSTPYGLLADVKMLNFFRNMSLTAAIVIGLLVLLSIVVENFWCRYLCPYGALMGLVSLLSPVRIRRDQQACIDCAKCAKAARPTCPSTGWSRSAPSNAPAAWPASRPARRRMPCSSRCLRDAPRPPGNAGFAAPSLPWRRRNPRLYLFRNHPLRQGHKPLEGGTAPRRLYSPGAERETNPATRHRVAPARPCATGKTDLSARPQVHALKGHGCCHAIGLWLERAWLLLQRELWL